MFVMTDERKIINLNYYVEIVFHDSESEKYREVHELMGMEEEVEEKIKESQSTEYQIRAVLPDTTGQGAPECTCIASFSLEQKEKAEAAFAALLTSMKKNDPVWDVNSFKSGYGVLPEISARVDRQTE